jgi:hypothetical protein
MTGIYAGSSFSIGTDHLAQDVGGDLRIERCGLQFLVTEQHLNHADVNLLLEEMGGEAVAPMPSSA